MDKKKLLLISIILGLIAAIIWVLIFNQRKSSLSNPLANQQAAKQILPSETFIEYTDPAGFTLSYPDNLSLEKNEVDINTYADLQLSAKGVNGSLALKISDSKFASIDDWVRINQNASKEPPKEVKLGELRALEVRLNDRLLLGALDQGVLFTIEMPLVEEDFWMKVYNKILAEFTFVPPSHFSSDGVIFEGEEVL